MSALLAFAAGFLVLPMAITVMFGWAAIVFLMAMPNNIREMGWRAGLFGHLFMIFICALISAAGIWVYGHAHVTGWYWLTTAVGFITGYYFTMAMIKALDLEMPYISPDL